MNIEQAINYLKSTGMSDEQIRTVVDAFTCEDAISRQAVLDILNDNWNRFIDPEDAIEESIATIEALTPVTPQQRWIPVSERLPNFNDIVLASADSDYDELRVILTVYGAEEFWFNGKIKAWMPLPEPYKAESEEE